MGPDVTGHREGAGRQGGTLDDGHPGAFYLPRFRNLAERQVAISFAAMALKAIAAPDFPGHARIHARIRRRVQEAGARLCRRLHQHGRLRRGAGPL